MKLKIEEVECLLSALRDHIFGVEKALKSEKLIKQSCRYKKRTDLEVELRRELNFSKKIENKLLKF